MDVFSCYRVPLRSYRSYCWCVSSICFYFCCRTIRTFQCVSYVHTNTCLVIVSCYVACNRNEGYFTSCVDCISTNIFYSLSRLTIIQCVGWSNCDTFSYFWSCVSWCSRLSRSLSSCRSCRFCLSCYWSYCWCVRCCYSCSICVCDAYCYWVCCTCVGYKWCECHCSGTCCVFDKFISSLSIHYNFCTIIVNCTICCTYQFNRCFVQFYRLRLTIDSCCTFSEVQGCLVIIRVTSCIINNLRCLSCSLRASSFRWCCSWFNFNDFWCICRSCCSSICISYLNSDTCYFTSVSLISWSECYNTCRLINRVSTDLSLTIFFVSRSCFAIRHYSSVSCN